MIRGLRECCPPGMLRLALRPETWEPAGLVPTGELKRWRNEALWVGVPRTGAGTPWLLLARVDSEATDAERVAADPDWTPFEEEESPPLLEEGIPEDGDLALFSDRACNW